MEGARQPVEWIRDDEALARLLPRIGAGPLAVDVEGDSLHHYPEKVCLLQLSFSGRDVLLDPLAALDPHGLAPLFADGGVRKVFHGADYDLRVLQRDFALRVHGLFDTMIAARLVGERAFGLSALLERHLGVRLDKRFQRADWSRRPLSSEMEAYAVMDTRYLIDLSRRLERRLEELGRKSWAEEEFARLESIRFSERVDPEAFRRVKGGARLERRALAVLRELHAWREDEARRRDRPPFRVLHDEQLVQLAAKPPARRGELPSFAARQCKGRSAEALLAALARGLACPEGELPEAAPRGRRRGGGRRDAAWKRLHDARDRIAAELDLEPSLLATRSALEQALARAERGEEPGGAEELRAWQLELLRPALGQAAG